MTAPSPAILDALLSNHKAFLAFLERRTGNRADAEDLLQAAFVRALEKGGAIRDGESAVAWFYRLLRNALVDRYRSDGARYRAHEAQAIAEPEFEDGEDQLLRAEVCRCITDLLPTLKPEYAELLRRVDLGEEPIGVAASSLGITANNASVRLHRARNALLAEVQRSCRTCATHGCFDCSCGPPRPPARGGEV